MPLQPFTLRYDPERKKHIAMFDASSYKSSNCPRYTYYSQFAGMKDSAGDTHKMEYGVAFHIAMELYYRTLALGTPATEDECLRAAITWYAGRRVPPDAWRNAGHLGMCIMQYMKACAGVMNPFKPLVIDGTPLVEKQFNIPFYESERVIFVVCGVIDLVAEYCGYPCVVDHKTTAVRTKDSYIANYSVSRQLMLYLTVVQKLFVNESWIPYVKACVNCVFLRESGKNEFQRSPLIDFSSEILDAFNRHFKYRIEILAKLLDAAIMRRDSERAEDFFMQNFTCCNTTWGICQFAPACLTKRADDRDAFLATQFKQSIYDPALFREE